MQTATSSGQLRDHDGRGGDTDTDTETEISLLGQGPCVQRERIQQCVIRVMSQHVPALPNQPVLNTATKSLGQSNKRLQSRSIKMTLS